MPRAAPSKASTTRPAQALLDLYGYVDCNGDGWRERPDGSPLVLRMATQTSNLERQLDENWQKSLSAVGVRIVFETAQWPESVKGFRSCPLSTPKRRCSSLQMLAMARAMAVLCA